MSFATRVLSLCTLIGALLGGQPVIAQTHPHTFVISCLQGYQPVVVLDIKDAPILSKEYPEGSKLVQVQGEASAFFKLLPPQLLPSSFKVGVEMCLRDATQPTAQDERPVTPRIKRVPVVGWA